MTHRSIAAVFAGSSLALFIFSGVAPVAAQAPTSSRAVALRVDEKRDVQPENAQRVPPIARNLRNNQPSLPDLGRVGVDITDQRTLTLREAIALALENNKDIEVSRKNVRIAEFDLRAARGVYEPRFTGQTYYERATTPNISFFAPETRKTTDGAIAGNAVLQAFIPRFGTVLDVAVTSQRLVSDNTVSIVSPLHNANVAFSITQPLFRGRGFDQNRRTIEIAKRNLSLTDTQFRQRSIEVINEVQRAYWDLTYALRNLQVQRDGARDANAQLAHNRRLVDEGKLAPIDAVASETQVAEFEQAVYDALNVVTQAENNLKNLISPKRTDTIWGESITPIDPIDLDAPDTTLPEALQAALENRPELGLNEAQKDINEIDRRFYGELDKPLIDLVASYTSAGVGGSRNSKFSNPFLPNCLPGSSDPVCLDAAQMQARLLRSIGGAGTTYTDILANKYPTFRFGVQISLPLFGDKTAKAQLGRSLVEAERLQSQREQMEQLIEVDVRNALQNLRTAEARLRSATIVRENSVRQYESEQRKLDAGRTDVYRVLERQTALTVARSNELRAQTELNKAIAELQRATGNSLKANDIEARMRK